MKDLNGISLLDVMPDSITDDAKVEAAAKSIDVELATVSSGIDKPAIYAGFDTLTSATLDHLAAQYDVTVWRDDWPDNVKRSVLRTAITDKRKKGTVGAVKNAVASLGSAVTIKEWWETGENVHTFKIYVAQGEIEGHVASDVQEDLIAAVEDAKPVRSHYDFIIQQPIGGTLNACGYVRMIACARVSSTEAEQIDIVGSLGVGAFVRPMVMRRLSGFAETEIIMPPPIEEFGEIIPVFFSTNGADSPRIDLRYEDAPAYDEAGNPVHLEEGWIYESSETKWHSSRLTTNVLATIYTFPNVSSPMARLSNKTAGSAVQIYTTDHVNALGAYLFRAKEPFYFAWLYTNGGGTKSIAPGVSVPLYHKGSMSLMGYSDLSPLKLRAALGKTAEYLDISTLEIVQKDVYYAYLKNNGTEAVDVYCLIFSD